MALTLEEVAKLAGVSRSTVSRVVNEHPSVRSEVRDRVWQVIRETDYHPHQAARTLVTRRTNALGLLIPEAVARLFTDPFFPQLTQGIAEVCNQHDYYLTLTLMTNGTDREKLDRRLLHGGYLDGIIVASARLDDPLLSRLQESQLPYVWVGRHPEYPNIAWVDVDNLGGARSMTEYLIRLGHRRIGTITGPWRMIAGCDRLDGYRQALAAAGLAYNEDLVAEGDFTEDGGYRQMQRLLAARPTAVFVASDTMALGALRALREVGKRVPEDISLVSYDDMTFAAHTAPPLTTIRQPIQCLGAKAAEILLERIDQPDTPARHVVLPTEIVVRDSAHPVTS